jgi:hypothetical protein
MGWDDSESTVLMCRGGVRTLYYVNGTAPRRLMVPLYQKVHLYTEYHSVCPLVGIGTLRPPLLSASVPLPPEPKGRGHTRQRERGWESPNPTTGEKA